MDTVFCALFMQPTRVDVDVFTFSETVVLELVQESACLKSTATEDKKNVHPVVKATLF